MSVVVLVGGSVVRAFLRTGVSGDEPAGEIIYREAVRARASRPGKTGFGDLKPGPWSLILTVKHGLVTIRTPGLPRRIAAMLGLDYTFNAEELWMYWDTLGWLGTSVARYNAIVICGGEDWRGPIDLALGPRNDDLDRLRRALLDAGVSDQPRSL